MKTSLKQSIFIDEHQNKRIIDKVAGNKLLARLNSAEGGSANLWLLVGSGMEVSPGTTYAPEHKSP